VRILHAVETTEERFELDPLRGPVRTRVKVLKPSALTSLVHDGKTYKADSDGVCDVPEAVGAEMIKRKDWHLYLGDPEVVEALAVRHRAGRTPAPERNRAARSAIETAHEGLDTAESQADVDQAEVLVDRAERASAKVQRAS